MSNLSPFKVGDWLVEPSLDRISRGDEQRALRPQVMQLLVYLAERPGEVVSTEQLFGDLWQGRIVTEGTLYNCVSELRVALAVNQDDAPAVENIPKKGYRLVAPVSMGADEPAKPRRRRVVVAAAVLILLGGGLIAWLQNSSSPDHAIASLGVLPLDNLSPNPESDEYIANGMTDVVIARLSRIPNLRVISRTTTAEVKRRGLTVPEILAELDIDAVIEGSVLNTEDGQTRITLQLIDAHSDGHLWSRNYLRSTEDIIELQDEVSQSVAAELYARLAVTPEEAAPEMARKLPTTNSDAYRAYLQGLYKFSQFGEENFRAALAHYDEAIEIDPGFALAHASRAELCLQPVIIMKRIMTLGDCYRDALRATELDAGLSEAHAALGFAQLLRWEWESAGRSLDRAVEINPNSIMARQWRTIFYRISSRFEEALAEIRYAEERDMRNLFVRTMVSWPLYDMRRYDEALAQLDSVLELEQRYMLAHYNRGLVYIEMRDANAVFDAADRVAEIAGEQAFEARLLRASAHAIAGQSDRAREIVAAVEADGGSFLAAWIASISLMLGDEDAALQRLERGLVERAADMMTITEPKFDSVRQHPRFRAIAAEMGLPQIG